MSEVLEMAKLATSLQRRIDALYADKCIGDDISAPVLDLILDHFEKVGDRVEERLKEDAKLNRAPG